MIAPSDRAPAQAIRVRPLRAAPERAASRILVIDDEASNVRLLSRLLTRIGYTTVRCTTNDRTALSEYRGFEPDLVLLDLRMPHVDGYSLLRSIRDTRTHPSADVPVLVLTADSAPEARRRAWNLGANGFLLKPFELDDIALHVAALLELRAHAQAAFRDLEPLRNAGREGGDLAGLHLLDRLAETCIYRDRMSPGHNERVARLAADLATELNLPAPLVGAIRRCAPLHDLGKVAIPDEILLKPGPLTPEERAVAEKHTTLGALILSGSRYPLLRFAANIALTHHERWDGTGYPRRLRGTDIPIAGRIVAVADVFDALVSERPYKQAWPLSQALAVIGGMRGTHFDPDVVDALLRILAGTGGYAAA